MVSRNGSLAGVEPEVWRPRSSRLASSLFWHLVFGFCLLILACPPSAMAAEQFFPGIRLTLDVPPEWLVDNVAGSPASDRHDNLHQETIAEDLREGDFAPLISFILVADRSTFYPMIRFFATKRGSDTPLDRARWTMSVALSEKRTAFPDFKLLMPSRKFKTAGVDFYYSEASYTMRLDGDQKHAILDQVYAISTPAALIVVDVKTSPGDSTSRRLAADLMKWFRFD